MTIDFSPWTVQSCYKERRPSLLEGPGLVMSQTKSCSIQYLWPQRFRNVDPGAGRTLLTLEFKGRPDGSGDDRVDVSRGVDEMVVLAAALSNQLGKTRVIVQVLAHRLPQPLKRPDEKKNHTYT